MGSRIRVARLQSSDRLTQDQLSGRLAAKEVSIDRAAIAKIESGKRCVYDNEVVAFAQVLKVDPSWLLGILP